MISTFRICIYVDRAKTLSSCNGPVVVHLWSNLTTSTAPFGVLRTIFTGFSDVASARWRRLAWRAES